MSSLNLTKFTKVTDKNDNKYAQYEKDLVPEKNMNVFIYTNGETVEDKANIQIVKKAFGYAKLDKFANMTTAQIKAMNKDNANGFVANKTK